MTSDSDTATRAPRSRRIALVAALVVATLLWLVAIFAIWAQRQVLNTDNWTTTSQQLLRDDKIRVALSGFLLDRLYQSHPGETKLKEALPPVLKPLSAPIASAAREAASRAVPHILGTEVALAAWEKANRGAHKAFLRLLDGSGGDVSLDLKSLLKQVAAGTGLPPDIVNKLPAHLSDLTVVHSGNLKTARSIIHGLKKLPWILLPLAIILFGLAVYLSPDRRRTMVSIGACILFAGVAVLALRRIGGHVVVNSLAKTPDSHGAATNAWTIATDLLTEVAEGSILMGLFVITGAWLAGAGRRATALRRVTAPAFRESPVAVRVGLGVLVLLLVMWGPVPWTQSLIPVLVLIVASYVWLEWVRRSTLEEFPDATSGGVRAGVGATVGRLRGGGQKGSVDELERLAALHERGVLTDEEFARQKAALMTP